MARVNELADVVIAGEGPTGLRLACELALAGLRATVLEKLPSPAGYRKRSGCRRGKWRCSINVDCLSGSVPRAAILPSAVRHGIGGLLFGDSIKLLTLGAWIRHLPPRSEH